MVPERQPSVTSGWSVHISNRSLEGIGLLASSASSCLLLLLCGDVEVDPGPHGRSHRSSFINAIQKVQYEVRCSSLDARGVMNKSLDLHVYLQSNSLDVYTGRLCDFFTPNILDGEFLGCYYAVHRCNRNQHGGRVMLIVPSSIPPTRSRDRLIVNIYG